MISGIYKILNKLDNKCYIGSSQNIKRRIKDHMAYLGVNKHCCTHLQNAYNKHGKYAFDFVIIEYCSIDKLTEREQYWIDSLDRKLLYNTRVIAESNRGYKFSEEAKLKLKGRLSVSYKRKGIPMVHVGSIKKGERRGKGTEFKIGIIPWNKGMTGCKSHMAGNTHTIGMPSWNKGIKGWNKNLKRGNSHAGFELVSPHGILYTGVGVKEFAYEMGLTSAVFKLIKGRIKKGNYRGWTLPSPNIEYTGYGFWECSSFPISRTAVQS